jgi:phage terminase large subunit-like protein
MVEVGESSILKTAPPWFRPEYEPSKRRLTWPNGCVGLIYSGDEPDQLRGPQHDTAWVDELAKFKYPKETWDNLEMGLRLGPDPRVLVTSTPRPLPIIRQLLDDPDCADVVGSTYENFQNLSPTFIKRVLKKYEGTRLGLQELHGVLLEDVPGALFRQDMFERTRVREAPSEFVRVGVAVDPSVTANRESNETGIIVGGITEDEHVYIWQDASIKASPKRWAQRAVAAYRLSAADIMVAEVNNGGDMVESTIHTVDSTINVKKIRASRGKYTRAEPVAALYEKGMVHHVGTLSDLETQSCNWVPGEDSPDRMDAMVWLVTELALGPDRTVERTTNPFYG